MNRIICDICGAEYDETAERCPVCNYPRQGTEKVAAAAAGATVHTKVKGGRFSSKNVRKRKKAQNRAARNKPEVNPNRPLIITIILLLIAIALVSAYIAVRFLQGTGSLPELWPPKTTAAATTVPTETTLPPTVPCEGIVLEAYVLDLEEPGEQKQLAVKAVPENTTDVITFVSADPSVAEITDTGLITAVGSGQTTVTITCGGIKKTCTVVCWFQDATTVPAETAVPTEPTVPQPTEPQVTESKNLVLNQTDVSCFSKNESFTIYVKLGNADVSRSKVTWTSSDPNVATVEKGTVTAVGKGTATITAEYNGKKAECTVRCRFEDTKETEGSQDQEQPENTAWKANHSDVSIVVGESFRLTVKNDAGETADAIWTQSMEGVVSVEGGTITGRMPGTVTLTTTVDGVTLTCIVRVK